MVKIRIYFFLLYTLFALFIPFLSFGINFKNLSLFDIAYQKGYSIFAIDSIQNNYADISLSYQESSIYYSNPAGKLTSLEGIRIGHDLNNPYQGIFYRLLLGQDLPTILFSTHFELKYQNFEYKESNLVDRKYKPLYGKLQIASRYQNFYLGGFLLSQNVSSTNWEYSMDYTNFYYALSAGFKYGKGTIALIINNIYNTNTENTEHCIAFSDMTSDVLIPHWTLKRFRSSLYRFNTTSSQQQLFYYEQYLQNSYLEQIGLNDVFHIGLLLQYEFPWTFVSFLLDYYTINYASGITKKYFEDTNRTRGYYSLYDKSGQFDNLRYEFVFQPKIVSYSPSVEWIMVFQISGLLSSRMNEEITRIQSVGFNGGTIQGEPQNLSIRTDFSQNQLLLVLGRKNKENVVLLYGMFWNYMSFDTDYKYDSTNMMPFYQGFYEFRNPQDNRKKKWQTVQAGLIERIDWEQWQVSLGSDFFYSHYPTVLKYFSLKYNFEILYRFNKEIDILFSYHRNIFFPSQNYISGSIENTGNTEKIEMAETEIRLGCRYMF